MITCIIEGKIKGKPGRGKPRQSNMKQIILDLGIGSYKKIKGRC
jgi:hypothetical protein